MKNLKIFIVIIVTIIISVSSTAYAMAQFYANQISYTPSATNKEQGVSATNVADALDELYTSSANIANKINGQIQTKYYMGNRENGKQISLNLTKGNYYVYVTDSHSWGNNTIYNYNGVANYQTIKSDNFTCQLLNGYYTKPTASKLNGSIYISQYTYTQIYKCSSQSDGDITFTTADGTYLDCSQSIILQSLKIN
ncbi:MAG TPA: hypothetical protein PKG93_03120 [Bacilli bacterium]|nr:hypothetical protein [Bacilli bacterium]